MLQGNHFEAEKWVEERTLRVQIGVAEQRKPWIAWRFDEKEIWRRLASRQPRQTIYALRTLLAPFRPTSNEST